MTSSIDLDFFRCPLRQISVTNNEYMRKTSH